MGRHVNQPKLTRVSPPAESITFTPFAGLMNIAKRAGIPGSVMAPILKGAGVPETVDLSQKLEQLTRQIVEGPKPKRSRARRLKAGR